MSQLLDKATLRYDTASLQKRVEAAMATAAYNVLNEADTTANHTARMAWAVKALFSRSALVAERERLMWFVALNPTVLSQGEAVEDDTIQWIINSAIDPILTKISGASA